MMSRPTHVQYQLIAGGRPLDRRCGGHFLEVIHTMTFNTLKHIRLKIFVFKIGIFYNRIRKISYMNGILYAILSSTTLRQQLNKKALRAVILQELIVAQLLKKIPASYGIKIFITVIIRAGVWTLHSRD
jgi:hypothetical protein